MKYTPGPNDDREVIPMPLEVRYTAGDFDSNDLLGWYQKNRPRKLALTVCPRDDRILAVAFTFEGRTWQYQVGYRMTKEESFKESIALQLGDIVDAYDRGPTPDEMREIIAASEGCRFVQPARVRPLLPGLAELVSCPRCRRSYKLDCRALQQAAQRGRGERVPVDQRQTIDQYVQKLIRRNRRPSTPIKTKYGVVFDRQRLAWLAVARPTDERVGPQTWRGLCGCAPRWSSSARRQV